MGFISSSAFISSTDAGHLGDDILVSGFGESLDPTKECLVEAGGKMLYITGRRHLMSPKDKHLQRGVGMNADAPSIPPVSFHVNATAYYGMPLVFIEIGDNKVKIGRTVKEFENVKRAWHI